MTTPRYISIRRPGFTLIELVIAICAGGIISMVAGTLLLEASWTLAAASQRAKLADQSARAVEQVLRYVREIDQDAALTGLAQITTANTTDLRFGVYGFRLTGTTLEMSIDTAASWQPVCNAVSTLTFRYYDKNGSQLSGVPLSSTDRANVRQVSVELIVGSLNTNHRVRSRVYLRNFMNEAAS